MKKLYKNQLWRLPLLAMAIAAVYYLIMHIFWGQIPSSDTIILFRDPDYVFANLPMVYKLPFQVSRIIDLPLIGILVFFLTRLIQYRIESKDLLGQFIFADNWKTWRQWKFELIDTALINLILIILGIVFFNRDQYNISIFTELFITLLKLTPVLIAFYFLCIMVVKKFTSIKLVTVRFAKFIKLERIKQLTINFCKFAIGK